VLVRMLRAVEVEETFEALSGTDDDVNLSARAGGMQGPLHRKR
jgi:hypothetical protein